MEIYKVRTDDLYDTDAQLEGNAEIMVPFQSLKYMAEQYEKLPPIQEVFRKEKRFSRVLAGLMINIRRKFGIDVQSEKDRAVSDMFAPLENELNCSKVLIAIHSRPVDAKVNIEIECNKMNIPQDTLDSCINWLIRHRFLNACVRNQYGAVVAEDVEPHMDAYIKKIDAE